MPPAASENPLSLVALPTNGQLALYDDMLAVPGVHLRWSFPPQMGFPPGGFTVKRQVYGFGEFSQIRDPVTIMELRYPVEMQPPGQPGAPAVPSGVPRETTLEWLSRRLSGAFAAPYADEVADVTDLLSRLRLQLPARQYHAMLENRGGSHTRMRVLEILMLASLDPYVARMLGLYFVDGSLLPGTRAVYEVTGHWMDNEWPLENLQMSSIAPEVAVTGSFRAGGVALLTGMEVSYIQSATQVTLRLRASAVGAPLQIAFDSPMREVVFELRAPARPDDWHFPSSITREFTDNRITLRAPTPQPAFEITTRNAAETVLDLAAIHYRSNVGRIGSPPGAKVEVYTTNSPASPAGALIARPDPVFPVQVRGLRRAAQPPSLADDGNVLVGRSNAEILCTLPPEVHGTVFRSERPARVQVRYRGGSPPAGSMLTTPGPRLSPSWELIGFWPFNGNYNSSSGAPSFTPSGVVRFDFPTDDLYDASRQQVAKFANEATGSSAGGRLDATLPALTQLGTHLLLQAWVRPDNSTRAEQTLFGNQANTSFWLGLVRKPDGLHARFHVNGRGPFDSAGLVPVLKWTHIAALYDGKVARVYLNGRLEMETPARLGPVRPATRAQLNLGSERLPGTGGGLPGPGIPATPTPPRPFANPYQGLMADVQVWRGRYAMPSAANPHFLAGWQFNNSPVELKTGRAADVRGTITYAAGHPQQPGRSVLALDGRSFLEMRDLPALSDPGRRLAIEAWVWPDPPAGQSTLFSAGQNQSFWVGLVREGDACRLAVQVNQMYFTTLRPVIPVRDWSHVMFGFDGQRVVMYANERFAGGGSNSYGRISPAPSGVLSIGADAGSPLGSPRLPFAGRLADVYCWNQLPAVPAPAVLYDWRATRRLQVSAPEFQEKYGALRAAWPLDGASHELVSATDSKLVHPPAPFQPFEAGHPDDDLRRVLVLSGSSSVHVTGQPPEFYSFTGPLALRARVYAEPGATQEMTILSNHRTHCFALVLRPETGVYRPVLLLGGRSFVCPNEPGSPGLVMPRTWTKLAVRYLSERQLEDGTILPQRVIFSMNGREFPPLEVPSEWSPVAGEWAGSNPDRRLFIGLEVQGNSLPFRGRLADVEIWTPDPVHPAEVLPTDTAGLLPPASYIAHELAEGSYSFHVQGVDLFGRASSVEGVGSITLAAGDPPAPAGAKARFVPLRFPIRTIRPVDAGLLLETGEVRAEGLDLLMYDAEVVRLWVDPAQDEGEETDPSAPPPAIYARNQPVEIREVHTSITGEPTITRLVVRVPPFGRASAEDVGRELQVAFDRDLLASWTWTGTQRLFAPNVQRFQLYERHVIRERSAEDAPVIETMTGWTSLAASEPEDLVVREEIYRSYSPFETSEAAAVSHDDWKALVDPPGEQGSGVPWLPEPPDPSSGSSDPPRRSPAARLYRATLIYNSGQIPDPAVLTVEGFVPGALVAYNAQLDALAWQHFQVVWHEWHSPNQWVLYFVQNQVGQRSPSSRPQAPRLQMLRYYPGQRYRAAASLSAPVSFRQLIGGVQRPVGTVRYEVAVTALDERRRESDKSNLASLVAVDRRRPLEPPVPMVTIGRADFNGRAPARIRFWLPAEPGAPNDPGDRYLIYRATDSAIFNRDMEQRRRSQNAAYTQRQPGYYSGLSPLEVFDDDSDFLPWLEARFPGWVSRWQTDLFTPQPDAPARDAVLTPAQVAARAAWDAASQVWSAWAERFYPALSDHGCEEGFTTEIQAIANRAGNEAAFSLVNVSPFDPRQPLPDGGRTYDHDDDEDKWFACFDDSLPGTVRNRYFYRLRAQSPSLLPSSRWSGTSCPAVVELSRAPHQPVFTKVEAGDRSITLHWALNREPNLKGYRLYRSINREDVEDLRWWEDSPPDQTMLPLLGEPRLLPDPRLVIAVNLTTGERYLDLPLNRLPAGPAVRVVTGVYRAAEYPPPNPNPTGVRPFNYLRAPLDLPGMLPGVFAITGLRRMGPGTQVVVEVRDEAGETRVIEYMGEGPVYQDEGLLGLTDYYYRLVAVNAAGNLSEGSEVAVGRSYDITPPISPSISLAFDSTNHLVMLQWVPDLSDTYMIQRREQNEMVWRNISQWLPLGTTLHEDHNIQRGATYYYRLRVKSRVGNLNDIFVEQVITLPE